MGIILLLGLVLCGVTSLNAATDKVVCYFGNSAVYRTSSGKFDIEDINPNLCTHIIYAFVGLDPKTNTVKVLDPMNDIELNGYKRFLNLKNKNRNVKLMLSIGGPEVKSEDFSTMAFSSESRKTFINSVVTFLKTYSFDGLDIYWMYPVLSGGDVADRVNFVMLLAEVKTRFRSEGLLLSIAVAATKDYHRCSYDVPEINKYVDFVNLMTHDMHGSWDAQTGHNSPLYGALKETDATTSMYNVAACVRSWMESGLAASKLVLGIPVFAQTYTLASTSENAVGSRSLRYGAAGIYTLEEGMLSYLEVCQKLRTDGYTKMWNNVQKVPYAFSGNQWISYDDVESAKLKVNYAKSLNLAGVMLWSIDHDDDRNVCGGGAYPITSAVYNAVFGSTSPPTTTTKAPTTATTTPKTTIPTAKPTTTTTKATTTTPRTTTTKTTAKTTTTTKSTATTARPEPTIPSGGAMICSSSGFKRDPNDCRCFYQCNPGSSVNLSWRFTCQAGLLFDETTNTCNWSYLVKC